MRAAPKQRQVSLVVDCGAVIGPGRWRDSPAPCIQNGEGNTPMAVVSASHSSACTREGTQPRPWPEAAARDLVASQLESAWAIRGGAHLVSTAVHTRVWRSSACKSPSSRRCRSSPPNTHSVEPTRVALCPPRAICPRAPATATAHGTRMASNWGLLGAETPSAKAPLSTEDLMGLGGSAHPFIGHS